MKKDNNKSIRKYPAYKELAALLCQTTMYCRANQEWQWRNILFTIAIYKYNTNMYTSFELTQIDRSLVY